MTVEIQCPWCEERMAADLASSELCSVTCSYCLSSVDLAAEAEIALPVAA